ncbi:hypothetical protein C0Q70_17778 [Pomacea canaliculata]|uniref:RING-type domain-containing protein n=1 Tax=Pomacea canaliculata TaxID=400727 RepID=A0A2T7NLE0_POMCA|nr:E3 ubiquitin-protein ligase TRIM33-like [Pomacea canaliculata]PVD21975.1 hypothetical protein C0Q70_17778 [Pomacea canaliculata]
METVSCEPPDTECSVCHNNFVEPKILFCGHLLCRECIVSIIKSKNQSNCPLCINPIASQEALKSQSPESIADSLPTDFVMDALVLSVDLKTQRPVCCGCRREEADSICLQCREMLCPACTNVHKNFSMSRSHEVKSLGSVTAESLAASRIPLCVCQGDKMMFYCANHGFAVCGSCALKTHKSCPEMSDLDTEMNAAKEAVKDLNETLSSAEKKMEKSINELNTCLMGSNSCEKLCNRLVTICNKYTKTLKSASSRKVLKSVRDASYNLQMRLARVKSHARIVSRAGAVCPRPELIYAKQTLQDRIKTLDFSTTWPSEVDTTAFIEMMDFKNLIRQVKCELTLQEERPDEIELVFHMKRGCSVMLGLNQKLAVCQGPHGGVVVSRDALLSDVLYQISIMEMRRDWKSDDIKFCGITQTYPNDLNIKQRMCEMEDVQTADWPDNVDLNVDTSKAIGLMIDSTDSLHIFLQERDLGIALRNVQRPCYAVFDLGINVTQVLALPSTEISENISQDMVLT